MAVAVLGACSAAPSAEGTSATRPPAGAASAAGRALSGTVDVLAAASLRESFTTLAARFEASHPGVTVSTSFGASSALAQAIEQGSPADVFASASQPTMDRVVRAGAVASATTFARNVMEIAVPPSNPAGIAGVGDLARAGVKVAVCQPQVPCGDAAARVFAAAGVAVSPVTQEADVKAVLTKVQLGEVDAGVVYVTDVRAAGDKVAGVAVPAAVNTSTSYPIAALRTAASPDAAAAFVAYVLSAEGRSVLTAAGFAAP